MSNSSCNFIVNIGVHSVTLNIETVIELDLNCCKRIHKKLTTHVLTYFINFSNNFIINIGVHSVTLNIEIVTIIILNIAKGSIKN
jgi:hypothetical protein